MQKTSPIQLLQKAGTQRGSVFALILLAALLAFEVFNYSTTDFALTDLLGGDLKFLGIRWATILSIAFCGIDFAGIARLFTPEKGADEPAEVWYLFGAWLLAAAMNATLTWWGVAVATSTHTALGSAIIGQENLVGVVPVFVAVMVWVIRILIIGTFSIAGERLFSVDETQLRPLQRPTRPGASPISPAPLTTARSLMQAADSKPQNHIVRPAPKGEPTYHPLGAVSASAKDDYAVRR